MPFLLNVKTVKILKPLGKKAGKGVYKKRFSKTSRS